MFEIDAVRVSHKDSVLPVLFFLSKPQNEFYFDY